MVIKSHSDCDRDSMRESRLPYFVPVWSESTTSCSPLVPRIGLGHIQASSTALACAVSCSYSSSAQLLNDQQQVT